MEFFFKLHALLFTVFFFYGIHHQLKNYVLLNSAVYASCITAMSVVSYYVYGCSPSFAFVFVLVPLVRTYFWYIEYCDNMANAEKLF